MWALRVKEHHACLKGMAARNFRSDYLVYLKRVERQLVLSFCLTVIFLGLAGLREDHNCKINYLTLELQISLFGNIWMVAYNVFEILIHFGINI